MRGVWKGVWLDSGGDDIPVMIENDRVSYDAGNGFVGGPCWEAADEGAGQLRVKVGSRSFRAIYRQEGEHLLICYRLAPGRGRPTDFCRKQDLAQGLLILHRVKPGK
jgi:hypothetical protein